MLRERLRGACLLLALLAATTARAGGATAWGSTVDPRLVTCPMGDIAFHTVVTRFSNPIPNCQFTVAFNSATGWTFCPDGQPAGIFSAPGWAGTALGVYTDATGMGTIAIKAGGATTDSTVLILGDGVPLAWRFLSSVDQDGDLKVDGADEAIVTAKLGSHDLSADFDGDGTVTVADLAILRTHLGHACAMATPVSPRTWGTLKAVYR